MPIRFSEVVLYNAVTPKAVTSSTDATPIVVTCTTHGFATGDRVLIIGHTTNVAANGIFKITKITANSFSLQNEFTGADVAGTGGGAGSSGLAVAAPPILWCEDFRNVEIQVGTSGTATTTIKIAGSLGIPSQIAGTAAGSDIPNFAATVSPSNPYTFMQIVNLDTAATVNGATGIVVAGTDVNTNYEVNINSTKYLTVFPVTWSAGAITIKAQVVTNA